MNSNDLHSHSQNHAANPIVPADAENPAISPDDPSAKLPPIVSPTAIDDPIPVLENSIIEVEKVIADFWNLLDMDTNMTGRERQRLFGAKSRNYGFINKAYAIAQENPNFRPGNFWLEDMTKELEILEKARQLSLTVDQLKAVTSDFQLQTSNKLYHFALRIYGNLREQTRAGVAGAKALFDELLQFFTLHRRGRGGNAVETAKELERDFHSMMHGTADGEIIIKNESPHMMGGVHEVIDDVHRHPRHGGAEIKVEEKE